MSDRLPQWLVRTIPEELSIHDFCCCTMECTVSDSAVRKLRYQITAHDKGVVRHNTFEIKTETAA